MSTGIIAILIIAGVFTAGIKESEKLVTNELADTSMEINEHYGQLSLNAISLSKELSLSIEKELAKMSISFENLSNYPDKLEELISSLYEKTFYSLQKEKCSGAFFILNATVNPKLSKAENSKAGLYIKNMEPNIISSSSPTITLLHGFPSIGRENSINLHTQWSMEFDVSNAPFYTIPIEAAAAYPDLPLAKLYYWSDPQLLPGSSEEVMLCSIPMIDSQGTVYGVCGFEISDMLFKLSYMPANKQYSRMFCILSPITGDSIIIDRSLFAGSFTVKSLSEKYHQLAIKDRRNSFTVYSSGEDTVFLGFHEEAKLYPTGSPFIKDHRIISVLVPKEDINHSIAGINIILAGLLLLLLATGIMISIYFSKRYIKPISQGIELIKSSDTEKAPKTNIQELDDLIHYLSEYKKEQNNKAEQERHQLTMLEEFVERTKTLTPAEHAVFSLCLQGLNSQEIADELYLSINTIKTHTKRIFTKLCVTSREELMLYKNMLKEIGLDLR
jgi:DNA-binding CsgD family transcriptional regulator